MWRKHCLRQVLILHLSYREDVVLFEYKSVIFLICLIVIGIYIIWSCIDIRKASKYSHIVTGTVVESKKCKELLHGFHCLNYQVLIVRYSINTVTCYQTIKHLGSRKLNIHGLVNLYYDPIDLHKAVYFTQEIQVRFLRILILMFAFILLVLLYLCGVL